MTTLEELLADMSTVAERPSQARPAVVPPQVPAALIEISDADVVSEVPALPQPKRIARGTEPAATDADLPREVGLIDLQPMRSAHYAELSSKIEKPKRNRAALGALLVLLGAGVGAGGMAARSLLAGDDAPGAPEAAERIALAAVAPAPEREAEAQPAPVAEPEADYVALDELEPGEIEIDIPMMAIKPRGASASEGPAIAAEEPAAAPAALSLDAPCYDPECAALEADETDADTETDADPDAESDAEAEPEPAAAAVPVDTRTLPARPHASAIANAIVGVNYQLGGCGDAFGTRGAVRIKLHITPQGAVDSVAVHDGSANFRSCVSDALRRVRVHASTLGTTESLTINVH